MQRSKVLFLSSVAPELLASLTPLACFLFFIHDGPLFINSSSPLTSTLQGKLSSQSRIDNAGSMTTRFLDNYGLGPYTIRVNHPQTHIRIRYGNNGVRRSICTLAKQTLHLI